MMWIGLLRLGYSNNSAKSDSACAKLTQTATLREPSHYCKKREWERKRQIFIVDSVIVAWLVRFLLMTAFREAWTGAGELKRTRGAASEGRTREEDEEDSSTELERRRGFRREMHPQRLWLFSRGNAPQVRGSDADLDWQVLRNDRSNQGHQKTGQWRTARENTKKKRPSTWEPG